MSKKVQVTKEGLEELKSELLDLTKTRLPAAIKRKSIAMAHGDLSENAEYHDAKEEQRFLETRISELEDVVSRAEVVANTTSITKIGIGSTVKAHLKDKSDKRFTFHIVGAFEADPMEGKISTESPLGKAFMNKKKKDEAVVKAPAGEIVYIIDEIK